MSVLSAKGVSRLSLGFPEVDDVFSGFEPGDFVVLSGNAASFLSFLLSVRCQLPPSKGGLGSCVAFVDGGNMFDPYLVAQLGRSLGLDSKGVLDKIFVSRAFTAYQLSSLILERVEAFLRKKKCKLLVVSDVASLFFDRDIPKGEAKDLFLKVCSKLCDIAARKRAVVVATYWGRSSKRGLFFEAVLLGRANVLVSFKRRGSIFSFSLDGHPRVKPFSVDFSVGYVPLTSFMEV